MLEEETVLHSFDEVVCVAVVTSSSIQVSPVDLTIIEVTSY